MQYVWERYCRIRTSIIRFWRLLGALKPLDRASAIFIVRLVAHPICDWETLCGWATHLCGSSILPPSALRQGRRSQNVYCKYSICKHTQLVMCSTAGCAGAAPSTSHTNNPPAFGNIQPYPVPAMYYSNILHYSMLIALHILDLRSVVQPLPFLSVSLAVQYLNPPSFLLSTISLTKRAVIENPPLYLHYHPAISRSSKASSMMQKISISINDARPLLPI